MKHVGTSVKNFFRVCSSRLRHYRHRTTLLAVRVERPIGDRSPMADWNAWRDHARGGEGRWCHSCFRWKLDAHLTTHPICDIKARAGHLPVYVWTFGTWGLTQTLQGRLIIIKHSSAESSHSNLVQRWDTVQ